MNILARILCILETIPIKVPPTFFSSYQKECMLFLWGKSWPRLRHSTLTIPKLKGGLGLPDIRKYYLACQLTRVVDWNMHPQVKAWIQLEQDMSLTCLPQIPWIDNKYIPPPCKSHPLIGPTLAAFHDACHKYNLSSSPGPLTPLRHNSAFPRAWQPLFSETLGHTPQSMQNIILIKVD